VTRLNRYAEQSAPWREADPRERAAALYTLAEGVRIVGEALRPFLPRTAARIAEQLGLTPERNWAMGLRWGRLVPGTMTRPPVPLFPRPGRD
jgi:methionyl-tRNA synthetase